MKLRNILTFFPSSGLSGAPRKPGFGSLKALTGYLERTPDTRAGMQMWL